jgi:mannitol/fructose-specific phosphotransferase system IIA component (Ntr-type)
MNLKAILNRDQILMDMRAADRWQAIEELVDHLVATRAVNSHDRDAITTAVKRREAAMTTGLGFGVAVTLGDTELIQSPILAFGRSQKGIEYAAIDEEPVRFVFLLLRPAAQWQARFEEMMGLTDFLRRFLVRNLAALDQAADRDVVYDILIRDMSEELTRGQRHP